jgi:hypothetical protein
MPRGKKFARYHSRSVIFIFVSSADKQRVVSSVSAGGIACYKASSSLDCWLKRDSRCQ